jgi:DegV family protein with EDD domain
MTIQIVTDSVSDIPPDLLEGLPIHILPIHVMLNGKSYLDVVDLPRGSFYESLPDANPHPTTAAPSPERFLQIYEQAADQGAQAIFSIHVAGSFSAIIQSARLAAKEFTRIPVYPVDSGNLTQAEGLVVLQAARAARDGQSAEAIQQLVDDLIVRTYAYAKLDTIDYLLRSGRMSSIQHAVVALLGVKPILRMNNQKSKMEIARTRKRAFARVREMAMEVFPEAVLFGISHAAVPEEAQDLARDLMTAYPDRPAPLISEVAPALGVHVGPGSLCVNWIESPDQREGEKKGLLRWFK